MQSISDRPALFVNGFLALGVFVGIGVFVGLFALMPLGASVVDNPALLVVLPVGIGIVGIALTGFTIIQPNTAEVVTFFGKYVGSLKESGLLYTWPLSQRTRVPLKLINFVTDNLKVNDKNGNPIEIGAVIVWRVTDAAQASFNIDNYHTFVVNQSDTAIRSLAAHYPYDSETEMSLRGNLDEIAEKLKTHLQDRLALAGIVVEETKLSHLAYASEVAAAMLKRQQAAAIFQARQYMLENALAIIDGVVKHFEDKENLAFSDDKKAELINSLLIVMTSDKDANPVLSLGR